MSQAAVTISTGETPAPASGVATRDEKGRFVPKGAETAGAPGEPAEAPAEGADGAGADTPADGGEQPAAEPAVADAEPAKEREKKPKVRDLAKQFFARQRILDRFEETLKMREQQLASREAQVKPWLDAIAKVKDDPVAMAAEMAKVAEWDPDKFYEAWTHRKIHDAPSPEELERRQRAAVREEMQRDAQAQFQAQVDRYVPLARNYVGNLFTPTADGTHACTKFPLLSAYTPDSVAKEAINRVVDHFARTRVERPLDEVLAEIQQERRAELDALAPHLRPGGQNGSPSNRTGAAPAAGTSPASTRPTSVSNRTAASQTGAGREPTEQEAHALLIAELRRQGWR